MKKLSFLMLSSLLLNVWGSATVEVDLDDKDSPASPALTIGAVRKTGWNSTLPSVAKAFESIIAKKSFAPPEERASAVVLKQLETQLTAYHAKAAAPAMSAGQKAPKAPPVIQLRAVEAWPAAFVYDQGNLGSCTANSMAFILRYLSIRNSKTPYNFLTNPARLDISRLYQYFNTRYYEGILLERDQVSSDVGASMAGSILALDKYGCTPEVFSESLESVSGYNFAYRGWPYHIDEFATQPSPESYRRAFDPDYDGLNVGGVFAPSDRRMNQYSVVSKNIRYTGLVPSKYLNPNKVLTAPEKKAIVASFVMALSRNQPIYFGTAVDASFFNDQNGFIPTPNLATFSPIGGHAIVLVGYGPYNPNNSSQNYFKFINSWGSNWGQGGFGFFDEDYVANVGVFGSEAFAVDLPK